MTDRTLGLYLHIPFCRSKCAYCDFCSYAGREDDMAASTEALCREIAARAVPRRTVDTVYLGGGTPSLLPAAELERIFSAIRENYSLVSDAEITCEANPGTVDFDKFSLLKSLGVNRVSLGVQSLSDRALRALGRIHTAEEAEEVPKRKNPAANNMRHIHLPVRLLLRTANIRREILSDGLFPKAEENPR